MKETANYKGKTNKELADDFLKEVANNQDKIKNRFDYLCFELKCWNSSTIEDVLQDTLLKVQAIILRKGFKDGHYLAYFGEALENNMIQHLMKEKRKSSNEYSLEELPEDTMLSTSELIEEVETENRYHQLQLDKMSFAFNQLPEINKEVLLMVTNKLRYREIKRVLNLTIGQVKMRIQKARKQVIEYQKLYPQPTWIKLEENPDYSISLVGKIRDDTTGMFIQAKKTSNDFRCVFLPNPRNKELTMYLVHELVYHYHGDTHTVKGTVYHLDKNKDNNHVDNLYFEAT